MVLKAGVRRVVLAVRNVQPTAVADDVQLSRWAPGRKRLGSHHSCVQRVTGPIAESLLSLDVAEELRGVPFFIGDDGDANVRDDAENCHNGDDPGRPEPYGTLSPFQAPKDVCDADRTGEHEDWHEVAQVPRRDVAPQEQSGGGAAGRQQQDAGPRHLAESSRSKRCDEAPDAEEEEERHRRRDTGGSIQLVEQHTTYRRRWVRRESDVREYIAEAQTVGPEVGEEVCWYEGRAHLRVVVGGQELLSVTVDLGPDLLRDRNIESDAEFRVIDCAPDDKGDQSRQEDGEPPAPVFTPTESEEEPHRDEGGTQNTGPARGRAVEARAQDEDTAGDHTTPRRSFDYPEQGQDASQGEAYAPRDVLAEDVGNRPQHHPDRPAHDGGHQDPVPCRLDLPHGGIATKEEADLPEQERSEQARHQPGDQYGQGGELSVQAAGDQQDRHPDDGAEQAEVGIGPAIVHETLESESSVGKGQMAMEHGPRLQIKKVVFIDCLAEKGGWPPLRPENPDEWNRGEAHGNQRGNGESPPSDIEWCSGNGHVGGRDIVEVALVHRRVGAPAGRSHLK